MWEAVASKGFKCDVCRAPASHRHVIKYVVTTKGLIKSTKFYIENRCPNHAPKPTGTEGRCRHKQHEVWRDDELEH